MLSCGFGVFVWRGLFVCERAEDIEKYMCEESLKHLEGIIVNLFKARYCC